MKNTLFALSALITLLLSSCASSRTNKNYMRVEFDKQAHRGGRGLMPENTIPAMINAVGMGVTTLEMDVVITKDNKVVLSHEPFFSAEISTRPDGSPVSKAEERSLNIYTMEYEQVKKYDVGMRPHPVFPQQQKLKAYKPLLSEVLDSVHQYMMMAKRPMPFFSIEIKSLPAGDNVYHPVPASFVEMVMAVIKEKAVEERVIIQSFDIRVLKYLHEKYPAVKTSLLVEANTRSSFRKWMNDLGFSPTIYSPAFSMVTPALIRDCHNRNIRIIPWTVNDKATIVELKNLGVDGIITDYPELLD